MSLLSLQDHELASEALDFMLDRCDDLTDDERRQLATLRQWILLRKSQIEAEA
jgi:hypothetical protein